MLHFEIKGSGFPIVMIHGFPNNLSTWAGIDTALAQQYKVVLIDLPGVGKSPSFEGELSMPIMAKMILEVFDALEINKAIIIGHSMGGYTAMECLYQFPERIQGMSMVHSLASADNEEAKDMRDKGIALMKRSESGQLNFLKVMGAKLFASTFLHTHPELVATVVENGMQLSAHDISNLYVAIRNRSDHTAVLSKHDIPMQWIVGSEDTATPMSIALEQAPMSAVSDVRVYQGVGHMSMFEHKEQLIVDLSDFCHFCYQYK